MWGVLEFKRSAEGEFVIFQRWEVRELGSQGDGDFWSLGHGKSVSSVVQKM